MLPLVLCIAAQIGKLHIHKRASETTRRSQQTHPARLVGHKLPLWDLQDLFKHTGRDPDMRNTSHHVTEREALFVIISVTFPTTTNGFPSPTAIIKMPCAQTPECCLHSGTGSLGHWGLFFYPAPRPRASGYFVFSGGQSTDRYK